MKEKKFYPNYFTYPAIIVFTIFYCFPIIASFIMSFTNWNIKRISEPKFVAFKNFARLLNDDYFLLALKNTVLFAVVTTLGIVILGLLLALLLNSAIKGKTFLRTCFYLPAVLSLIVVGIMFKAVFKLDGGILNQILTTIGLESLTRDWLGDGKTAMWSIIFVQIWKWSGFAMTIYLAGLQGISKDYYEAATIDGAGTWDKFKNITLPLLAPAFTVVITMNTIGGFKVFEQVYVMTNGGPGNATQVLNTYIYKEFSKGTLGRSSAASLLLFLMISVIAVLVNRALTKREVEM
ncbi:sugar ABC transporter permease [Ruminococcus sp. AF24-32LB]|jgi:raffinose/stachyose/melibiose transport system permease protein|nr:sugar ABC transporter permease [Ruminococcus sp. AF24-32LB]